LGSLDVQALVCLLNRVLSLQTLDSGRFDRGQKFNTRMSSRILDLRDAFSFGDRDWLGSHAARNPLGRLRGRRNEIIF
jgi:hypothetical protein